MVSVANQLYLDAHAGNQICLEQLYTSAHSQVETHPEISDLHAFYLAVYLAEHDQIVDGYDLFECLAQTSVDSDLRQRAAQNIQILAPLVEVQHTYSR